jgi:PAS domain S-box-containing protein
MNKADRISVVRIVAIYALFSCLWIYLSDTVLGLIVRDIETITRLSVAKGIVFIILTTLLLYRLIIRHVQSTREAEERIHELNRTLEKRNAELDQDRVHWRAAIEGIADEVWIGDASGRMSLVNLPAVTDMGLEEFKNKTVEEILDEMEIRNPDGKLRPPGDAPLLRSLRGEIVRGEEIMLHRRTGKRRYRQFSSAPMRDTAGAITGAVAIVRDITDYKRVEEALCKAKEVAEVASRAKSQFLANMSHELRTPMTGVLGMLDLALYGPLEAEQRECIQTARHSAGSLVRILNDILEMTKIEAGILSIEERPFVIRNCLEEALEIFISVAKVKGLELVLSMTEDLPETVVGDQARLRQVLTSLVGNAVKFTEQGKVEVKVETDWLASHGRGVITFIVTDTGIGVSHEKRELLFDMFSQVDTSNTRKYGGLGLGLAISKKIVDLMGGTISFESEEGVGSSFAFSIPLRTVETGGDAFHSSGP